MDLAFDHLFSAQPTPSPSANPVASASAANGQTSGNDPEPSVGTAQPIASKLITSSPTKAPTTQLPSKAPTINANFCGISWEDHTKNCASSLPCPRGDECPKGQSCFSGSPCAVLSGAEDANVESNAGSFCGTEWNTLMATVRQVSDLTFQLVSSQANDLFLCHCWQCNSATRCPNGNECAEGEFCYKDFVCNPPPLPTTTTSTVASTTASTASLDYAANDSSANMDGEATTNEPLVPSESCSICGNSQLDWSQRVTFEGSDISCGEFGWIFLSGNIQEGSDRCLNFRAQYFNKCCYAKQVGNGCDLCDTGPEGTWHDIREDIDVEYNGDKISCPDLSNKVRTRFDPSSEQCSEAQSQHFSDCWYVRACFLYIDTDIASHASTLCYFNTQL